MQDSLLAVIFKNFEITLIIFFEVYKLGMKKKTSTQFFCVGICKILFEICNSLYKRWKWKTKQKKNMHQHNVFMNLCGGICKVLLEICNSLFTQDGVVNTEVTCDRIRSSIKWTII